MAGAGSFCRGWWYRADRGPPGTARPGRAPEPPVVAGEHPVWHDPRDHLSRRDPPCAGDAARWRHRPGRVAQRWCPHDAAALVRRGPGSRHVGAEGCPGARTVKRLRARLFAWLHRHPRLQTVALLLPAGAWLAIFFAVPLGIMATYAFRPRHVLGGVYAGWTMVHVTRLFEPLYLVVLERSVVLLLIATVLALLLSYPIAMVIVRASRWRALLLF